MAADLDVDIPDDVLRILTSCICNMQELPCKNPPTQEDLLCDECRPRCPWGALLRIVHIECCGVRMRRCRLEDEVHVRDNAVPF
jgi:hypothetical protein